MKSIQYTIVGIIHGIKAFAYDDNLISKFIYNLRDHIPHNLRGYIIFVKINWDNIVADRQLEAFEMEKNLPNQRILKLKHTLLSDIMWDVQTKNKNGTVNIYNKIVEHISKEMDSRLLKYGVDSNKVLIGHSWGGQRALSYCFDSVYKIDGLITMGSPITAVSGRFLDWGKLPDGLQFWLNFRNIYDWIGSQFKYHKNPAFASFVKDYLFKSRSPIDWIIDKIPLPSFITGIPSMLHAHSSYWTSKFVHKEIANYLTEHFYKQKYQY